MTYINKLKQIIDFTDKAYGKLSKLAYKETRNKRIKRVVRWPLAVLNYHLGNYRKDVIWIVGDGRSGTTWLGDLVNWHKNYREIFEPIHPFHVKRTKEFGFNPYLRPDDSISPLGRFLPLVFSGKFKHLRADTSKSNFLYNGLLIKDIYANLLLAWVHQNIPNVKKVLIIRNPFSVALSKQRRSNWIWMTEPKDFLNQRYLMRDYLEPFESLIKESGNDFVRNQILIWAITHYVPLRQLRRDDIYIIFYENLFLNPEEEITKLFNYLYGYQVVGIDKDVLDNAIVKPSRTQGNKFSTLSAQNPLDVWKNELTFQEIESGMKILESFGLASIYAGNSLPTNGEIDKIIRLKNRNVKI
ncbi:MAG: sulfotransferase domain-containing protein [Cyanobacteria bacterium P01_F01_bin.150]